jgi:YD repeat-containing protein
MTSPRALTGINSANANITRDIITIICSGRDRRQILLTGGRTKTTSYAYDADGNRAEHYIPDGGYAFGYTYTNGTGKTVNNWASYDYDPRGNLLTRTLISNSKPAITSTTRDRVTWIHAHLNHTRRISYGYQPNSDNRKYKTNMDRLGEVFAYDLADQVTAVQHISNPDTTPVPGQNIYYDSMETGLDTSSGDQQAMHVNGTARRINTTT